MTNTLTRTKAKPKFYDCGICGSYHPANWDGDCRDDAHRFDGDTLDRTYGLNWEEVEMPDGTLNPQRFLPGGVEEEYSPCNATQRR